MAKAWNNTVRSYSSSAVGAPWMWETRLGMLSTLGGGHGATGIVDQDVDAPVIGHHRVDECVDRPVVALIADALGGTSQPVRVVGHPPRDRVQRPA